MMLGAPLIGNIEAEQALLGALMIDNRAVSDAAEIIGDDDFFEPLHGRIFAAILNKVAAGKVASPVTLNLLFQGDEAMADVGGTAYLATLTQHNSALLAIREFSTQIVELAQLRRMRDALAATLARIGDPSLDLPPVDFAAEIEAVAQLASDSAPELNEMSGGDAIGLAIKRAREIKDTGRSPGWSSSTISDIGTITGGLEPKWLVILAGRPGMAKTATATSLAYGLARNGHGCGIISLEMDDLSLGMRMAADVTHDMATRTRQCRPVPHEAIRQGRLTDADMATLIEAQAALDALPIRLLDVSGATLSRIASQVRRWKRQMARKGQTLCTVIIDYLQLIEGEGKSDNRTQEIGRISRGLKRLAKSEGICIIALAQLSRQVEQRENKRPILSDLRDSGEIEQDADVVIFLYRDEYYLRMSKPDANETAKITSWQSKMDIAEGRIEFIPGKQRHGLPETRTGYFFGANQAVRGSDFYQRQLDGDADLSRDFADAGDGRFYEDSRR
jgi:replicative DNA helicase